MIKPVLSTIALAGLVATRPTAMSLTLSPAVVVGGNAVTATFTLPAPAPVGGTVVSVTTSAIAVAGLVSPRLGPLSSVAKLDVPVAQGASSATVTIQTFGVAVPTSVTIRAASGTDAAAASLTVNVASIRSLAVSPSRVTGGETVTGTVTLDGKAPNATGATVTIAVRGVTALGDGSVRTISDGTSNTISLNGLPVTAPPSVSIRGGASAGTFAITTTPTAGSTTVSVVASLGASQSASLTVNPPVPTAMQLTPPAVFGGTPTTGTVILNGPAPARGLTVPLSASTTDATVPASVVVPAGSDRQSFSIATQPVTSSRSVTITARRVTLGSSPTSISDGTSNTISLGESLPGASAALAVVAPPQLQSISAQPSSVVAGAPVTVSVAFSNAASSTTGGLVAVAQLSSDHPDAIQLPTSVPLSASATTFSSGPLVATVAATTLAPPATETVSLSASLGAQRVSTTLTVVLPIASFTLAGPTVHGGAAFAGSLVPGAGLGATQTVTFTSDHPDLVPAPASTALIPGSTGIRVPLRSSAVTVATPVTITASSGAQRVSATVTLQP